MLFARSGVGCFTGWLLVVLFAVTGLFVVCYWFCLRLVAVLWLVLIVICFWCSFVLTWCALFILFVDGCCIITYLFRWLLCWVCLVWMLFTWLLRFGLVIWGFLFDFVLWKICWLCLFVFGVCIWLLFAVWIVGVLLFSC